MWGWELGRHALTLLSNKKSSPPGLAPQFLTFKKQWNTNQFFSAYKESSQMNNLYKTNLKYFSLANEEDNFFIFQPVLMASSFYFFQTVKKRIHYSLHIYFYILLWKSIFIALFLHFLMEHVCDYWINMNVLSFATLLLL